LESTRSIQTTFADLVKRGKVYRAIISEDESVKSMFRNIDIPQDKRNLLHIRILKKSFPSINFTILEYGPSDENMEVLFGWGHHIHDERGHVFSSKNPKMVDTFEKLFQALSVETDIFDPFLPCQKSASAAQPQVQEERTHAFGKIPDGMGSEAHIDAKSRRELNALRSWPVDHLSRPPFRRRPVTRHTASIVTPPYGPDCSTRRSWQFAAGELWARP
jgi:hypothetical protein